MLDIVPTVKPQTFSVTIVVLYLLVFHFSYLATFTINIALHDNDIIALHYHETMFNSQLHGPHRSLYTCL